MALDRWLSPILDLARSLVGNEKSDEPYARDRDVAPSRPYEHRRDEIADAIVVADPVSTHAAPVAEVDEGDEDDASGEEQDVEPSSEPVVSLAMARLLASQGHTRRAIAMYETLQRRAPSEALAREADALREADPIVPEPRADEDDDGLAGENEIVTVRANATDVLVSWQVDEARIERGRKLIPDAESMSVRLVLFHRGGGREVRREERERSVERAGEWLVRDVPTDAWVTASVGLRRAERFVSLTHSSAARVP